MSRQDAMSQHSGFGQGIERVATVLHAVAKGHRSGMRMTDLAEETGLSKSTLHRLLNGLCKVGLLEQDEASGLFYLSFEMFVLGASAANRDALLEIAIGHMRRLEYRTNDTIFLSVRANAEAICVYRLEGSFPIKVLTLSVGDRRPLGVGAGSLALLAFHDDEEVESIIERNRDSLASYAGFSAADLFMLVESTRRQGHSFNDGRIIPEMCALGVPILGGNGRPLASISLAAIRSRMAPDRRESLVGLLKTEAKQLEESLSKRSMGLAHVEIARRFFHEQGGETSIGPE